MEEWKEWMDKIQKVSDDIEIPQSLHPDAVEQMLKNYTKEEKRTEKKYRISDLRRWGSLAAAAMVALVVLTKVSALDMGKGSSMDMAAEGAAAEMAAESAVMEETCEEETEEVLEEGPIATAGSYEEIYEKLTSYVEDFYLETSEGIEETVGSAENLQGDSMKFEAAQSETDYSVTNTRDAAVGEADIVKTDGTYIYVCGSEHREVKIVRAKDLTVCKVLKMDDMDDVKEIYVEDGQLTVLGEKSTTALEEDEEGLYYSKYQIETVVRIYDIDEPEQPKEIASVSQEGNYHSSRKKGEYLYLFTDCWKQKQSADRLNSYIPEVNGILLASDSIYLPGEMASSHYFLIGALNLNKPDAFTDAKGILCDSTDIYISHQNIYITQDRYDMDVNQTEIFKFWFYNGKIFSRAAGLVDGSLKDSFCIDEYNGDLRIVTTAWTGNTRKCSLYILDSDLQVTGSLENVAPGENVKSARFMGDIGYFVTFRQTDPLFCIDLSDPADPVILGELKVSGFSSYLHPYGEGLLLGMGEEAEESTGSFEGYKLSMFDVSQPGKMKELDKEVFKNVDMEGLDNYKTVLAEPDKNIIGVCLVKWKQGIQKVYYQIYRFDRENGFEQCLNYELAAGNADEFYDTRYVRGLYIGSTLYVVGEKEITAFDMTHEFDQIGQLLF